MPIKDQRVYWRPRAYKPNVPYTGDNADYIFKGLNLIPNGTGADFYYRMFRGIETQNQTVADVAMTGTVGIATTGAMTGVGTVFKQQLVPGQWILVGGLIFNVRTIASDTSATVSPAPSVAIPAGTMAYLPQTLVTVDKDLGNLIRGSIVRYPNGNVFAVGYGTVYLNGSALSSSLVASKRLSVAVLNPGTGAYSVYQLGMATPTAPTLTGTGAGTKNMQAGTYSVRIVPRRVATGGYNNPSPKTEVTITANQLVRITFPAMDTTSGQDAWDVYVTTYTSGGIQGPWYLYGTITTAQVSSAGGNVDIEWNDADVTANQQLEFDNDPPPDAQYLASLAGLPVLISCNGRGRSLAGTAQTVAGDPTVSGTSSSWTTDLSRGSIIYIDNKQYRVLEVTSATSIEVTPTPLANGSGLTVALADTSPGPTLRPAKAAKNGYNVEGFPARFAVAVDPPEDIIGFVLGGGRLFLMTENRLHVASLSGNPLTPVTIRPFWHAGFRNPQALVFINGFLYGYTTNGPTRSIADGDEGAQENDWAADVANVFANWIPERVRVGYDPVNQAIVYTHSNSEANSGGYATTSVLSYNLRQGAWSTDVLISDNSANQIVTGISTVSGYLYLTCSGGNYRWDAGNQTIGGYAATPFMALGADGSDKTITGMEITAHSESTINANIYVSRANEDIPLADLISGTSLSASGTMQFAVGSSVRTSLLRKLSVTRARLAAARVNLGRTASSGDARIDEMIIRFNTTGATY